MMNLIALQGGFPKGFDNLGYQEAIGAQAFIEIMTLEMRYSDLTQQIWNLKA